MGHLLLHKLDSMHTIQSFAILMTYPPKSLCNTTIGVKFEGFK